MTTALAPAAELGDVELMLRVQADDTEAFEALFDRFAMRAYRLAYAIAREDARTEDVVQEAFLSIWRSRAGYRQDKGAVIAWVMGIVRSRAIDSLRHHARHDRLRAGEEQIDERLLAAPGVEQTTIERDGAAHLRGVLAQLPAAQREVIALAYFGELTCIEISSELSLPLGTVKGRMRLGLQKLRVSAGPA